MNEIRYLLCLGTTLNVDRSSNQLSQFLSLQTVCNGKITRFKGKNSEKNIVLNTGSNRLIPGLWLWALHPGDQQRTAYHPEDLQEANLFLMKSEPVISGEIFRQGL